MQKPSPDSSPLVTIDTLTSRKQRRDATNGGGGEDDSGKAYIRVCCVVSFFFCTSFCCCSFLTRIVSCLFRFIACFSHTHPTQPLNTPHNNTPHSTTHHISNNTQ